MKLGDLTKSKLKLVEVFPRAGMKYGLIFEAKPVESLEIFNKHCPEPEPPKLRKAGGVVVDDVDDPGYIELRKKFYLLMEDFLVVHGVFGTPESPLEWETVKLDVPSTWGGWRDEARDFGLTASEISRIVRLAIRANSLNDDYIDEARDRYFRDKGKTNEEG